MRPTTDLQRTVAPFEVISEYTPSGDQPTAIDELARRIRAGSRTPCCSAPPAPASRRRRPGSSSRCSGPRSSWRPTRRWPRSSPTSSASCCPTTPSSTSSRTTTTTSPRRTSRRPTPTSRRTARSTTRSSGCATRRPTPCSPGATSSSSPPSRASTASARRRSTSTGWRGSGSARRSTATSCCARFVEMQYTRNDLAFTRGTFRVRGDTVEIIPVYEELAIRIEFFGDEIERIYTLHPVTGEVVHEEQEMYVFPASHYVAGPGADGAGDPRHRARARGPAGDLREAGQAARGPAAADAHDLRHRDDAPGRLLLRHRELLAATSTAAAPGSAPNCLLDYFPEDFLLVIDESHQTVPQIGAMYEGDMSRKRMLVEHGFRLPSAMDNRPLKWEEFLERIGQTIYLSATPGDYELAKSAARRSSGRADHPPHRAGRPGGRAQADQGPDRRPHARDPGAHRAQRARPRHDADEEDGRGPHRLPPRQGHPGPLPAQRHRHAAARRAAA